MNLAPVDGDTPATSALITALRRQVEQEAQAKAEKQQKQLALPGPPGQQASGKGGGTKGKEEQDDSSSSEDEELPPDPQNCSVSGPGFTVSNSRGRREKGSSSVTPACMGKGTHVSPLI